MRTSLISGRAKVMMVDDCSSIYTLRYTVPIHSRTIIMRVHILRRNYTYISLYKTCYIRRASETKTHTTSYSSLITYTAVYAGYLEPCNEVVLTYLLVDYISIIKIRKIQYTLRILL